MRQIRNRQFKRSKNMKMPCMFIGTIEGVIKIMNIINNQITIRSKNQNFKGLVANRSIKWKQKFYQKQKNKDLITVP